jgi:hypothetical protein
MFSEIEAAIIAIIVAIIAIGTEHLANVSWWWMLVTAIVICVILYSGMDDDDDGYGYYGD